MTFNEDNDDQYVDSASDNAFISLIIYNTLYIGLQALEPLKFIA